MTYELYDAIENGFVDEAKRLIKAGLGNNDYIPHTYFTTDRPLHLACQKGYTEIVELLLERGADVNTEGYNYTSPLSIACQNGYKDIAALLLRYKANIEYQADAEYDRPLHIACQNGYIEIVKLLLEYGANINACKYNDATPLHVACEYGYDDIVQLLIFHKANIHAEGKYDYTLLKAASLGGHVDVVKTLINNGIDANLKEYHANGTALLIACRRGDVRLVELLLAHQADVNVHVTGYNSKTPLYLACMFGIDSNDVKANVRGALDALYSLIDYKHNCSGKDTISNGRMLAERELEYVKIIRLLIQHKADVRKADSHYGGDLLAMVCMRDNIEVAKLLIEHGASKNIRFAGIFVHVQSVEMAQLLMDNGFISNINEEDNDKHTVLYYALEHSAPGLISFLQKNGVTSTKEMYQNMDLFCKAAKNYSIEGVQFMIEHGLITDINKQDTDGKTALYYACSNMRNDVVRFLVEHGATDTNGSAVLEAVKYNMIDIVQLMLDKDLVENLVAALREACSHPEYSDMAKLLIARKATNAGEETDTPLHRAVLHNMIDIIKLMFKQSLVNDALDHMIINGALHNAQNVEIIELLLEHKADIDNQNSLGNTLLHCACDSNQVRPSIVKWLVHRGANINIENNEHFSPLCMLLHHWHYDVAKFLIQNGADISSAKLDGYTLIKTLRGYQNGTCAANDSSGYGLAMLNMLVRGAEVNTDLLEHNIVVELVAVETHQTDIQNNNPKTAVRAVKKIAPPGVQEMYRYAVQAANIKKEHLNDEEIYNMICTLSEKVVYDYINSPFIDSEIQNKLLLNAFMWYRLSEDGTYQLQEAFGFIQNRYGLLSDSMNIIQLGENILSDENQELMKGHEYSRHVYDMFMNNMEKHKKNEDNSRRSTEEILSHSAKIPGEDVNDMGHLIHYAKNLAQAHPNKSWMLKTLCLRYDNEKFELFNAIKEYFDDLKNFHCVYNNYEYEHIKFSMEAHVFTKNFYNIANEYQDSVYLNMVNGVKDWVQKYKNMINDLQNQPKYQSEPYNAEYDKQIKENKKLLWSADEFMSFMGKIGAVNNNVDTPLDYRDLFHFSHFDQETANNIMELVGKDCNFL